MIALTGGILRRLMPIYNSTVSKGFSFRTISSWQSQYFDVDIDEPNEIATLKMKRTPANTFSLPFLTEFLINWDRLENAKDIRSVIITSSIKGIFCAGIDIGELVDPKAEQLRAFYKQFQEVWLRLYGSSKITIAAITGKAVAGGCVLSMCCDYRIAVPMEKSYSIAAGRIGLITPPWVIDTLSHSVGTRQAELMLQSARSFNSNEALKLGIIDEIAHSPEEVIARAKGIAAEWMKSPSHSHEIIKMSFRRQAIARFQSIREEECNTFCSHVQRDSIQQSIRQFVNSSKKQSFSVGKK